MPRKRPRKTINLISDPIFSTLVIFAIPTLFSNILQSLNGSINTIWVGRFLGEKALAATADANLIMFMLFSLIFGFGMAATVSIGHSFGRHDIDYARQNFGAAISLCFFLAIFLSLGGIIFSGKILHALNTPQDIFEMAKAYLHAILIAMPAILLMVMGMMGLRGSGDSLTPLWFMIVNVFLDVLFNPILILGLGPFPRLGIAGSAWATVIASYTALISMFLYIYWRDLPLRLKGAELKYLFPKPAILGKIFGQGIAMGLQMVVLSTASVAMISLLNYEGVNTIAAYNVSQQLWTYLQMPSMAVGAAVSAMAAQNIGAGNWPRVFSITRAGAFLTLSLTLFLLFLLIIFDKAVMTVFLGENSSAIATGRHIQLLASWSYLFFGLYMVFSATMRANRVVIYPLIALFIGLYPVRLGFYYLFYPTLKVDAIWLSFPIGSFVCFILLWVYYKLPYWRQEKKIAQNVTKENS